MSAILRRHRDPNYYPKPQVDEAPKQEATPEPQPVPAPPDPVQPDKKTKKG